MERDKEIEKALLGYLFYSVAPNASGTYMSSFCSPIGLYSNMLKVGKPSSFGSSPGFTYPVSCVWPLAAYRTFLGHHLPFVFKLSANFVEN